MANPINVTPDKKKPAIITPVFRTNKNEAEPFAFVKKYNGQVEVYTYSTEDEAINQRKFIKQLSNVEI